MERLNPVCRFTIRTLIIFNCSFTITVTIFRRNEGNLKITRRWYPSVVIHNEVYMVPLWIGLATLLLYNWVNSVKKYYELGTKKKSKEYIFFTFLFKSNFRQVKFLNCLKKHSRVESYLTQKSTKNTPGDKKNKFDFTFIFSKR